MLTGKDAMVVNGQDKQTIPIVGVNGKTIDVIFVFMKDNIGTVRLVTGIPSK